MKCYFCGKDASAKIGKFSAVIGMEGVYSGEIYVCDKHFLKVLATKAKTVLAAYEEVKAIQSNEEVKRAAIATAEKKRIADDEKSRLANIETLKREAEVAKKKAEPKTKVRKGIKKTVKKKPAFKYTSKAKE